METGGWTARGQRWAAAAWVAAVVGAGVWAYRGSVEVPWVFDDHVVVEKAGMPPGAEGRFGGGCGRVLARCGS